MSELEDVRAKLKEAENAYHDLALGVGVREITHQNGQKVVYTPTNRFLLKTYIEELKGRIAVLSGMSNAQVARPMQVFF